MRLILAVVLGLAVTWASPALAEYSVKVELKNVSGQAKENWPVVLRVYTVLGRNLDPKAVNAEGFHVFDEAGKEIEHCIEAIPPYDQPGNDEIIFILPKLDAGATLTYQITNTATKSEKRKPIDLTASPHNLLAKAEFLVEGKPAEVDESATHEGKPALKLSAEDATVAAKLAKPVGLTKDSWYYFGAWSRTQNVARYGYRDRKAAHFRFYNRLPATQPATRPKDYKDADALGSVASQCSTRDWLKVTFEGGHTNWGLEQYAAKASQDQANIEFVLEQPRLYYMEPGKTKGAWWLAAPVLLEQPEVNVRFDKSIEPLIRNNVYLFSRMPEMPLGQLVEQELKFDPAVGRQQWKPIYPYKTGWVCRPFAQERLEKFARSAVKGQRVSLCVGLYHTKPLENVAVSAGEGLRTADGASLPVESVEYCPGYIGAEPSRYMKIVGSGEKVEPVNLKDEEGVRYFFVTFNVPRDAKAGSYVGKVDVRIGEGLYQSVPVRLAVQELVQPVLRDVFVGLIYNGGLPDVNDMLKQYARSGFSQIMWFYRWLPYAKGEDGKGHVNVPELDKKMTMLAGLGLTGCGMYTDVQVDDRPAGHVGVMAGFAYAEAAASPEGAAAKAAQEARKKTDDELKAAQAAAKEKPEDEAAKKAVADKQTALKEATQQEADANAKSQAVMKQAYGRLLKELDDAAKAHPDWPRFIHMNWDEATPANEKMGWTNEFLPDAISTLDMQFAPLPSVLKYYNTPAFDDPADWAGPELYQYMRKNGKNVAMCGTTDTQEANRYQAGMWMINSGATYFHAWHIRGGHTPGQMAYDNEKKQTIRGHEMISWANGMDDLKAYRLLKDAMDQAKKDGKNAAAVRAAQEYLDSVFAVFNGDVKHRWSLQPYLGAAYEWGYERFYDDWQEQMLRHAAAVLGVKWN